MYVCIYMYTYLHICIYVYTCIHIYTLHIYISLICIYAYTYIHVCIDVYIYVYMNMLTYTNRVQDLQSKVARRDKMIFFFVEEYDSSNNDTRLALV